MKWRASDLVFLPIVARELRVAARRPRTYFGRMMAVAIWVVIAADAVFVSSKTGMSKLDGLALFSILSASLFAFSLFSAWAGIDSISVEKREGTIGFLFLTDLKSHDIVLGKMAGAALPVFYSILGALPLLAICLLMGGVTTMQYVKTGLAILNIFFLGQAIGIFSSAFCRLRGNATGLPILIFLLYLAAFALATMAAELKGWEWPGIFFQLNNPFRPFHLAMNVSSGRFAAPGYWLTLLVAHLHAWMFLALASWVLPRRWRENPKKARLWKRTWERWRYGSMAARTAFRRRLVSVHPILWLFCRGRFGPDFVWIVMGVVAGLAIFVSVRDIMDTSGNGAYAECFVASIVSLQMVLRMGVPADAALLEEQRRNGSLEILLCCTPMTADDILGGMWLVLRRYYRWPVLVLVAVEVLMFLAALIAGGLRHSLNVGLLCFIGVSTVLLLADLRAMAWMAMLGAMKNPKPRTAGPTAFFLICMIPWIPVSACYATQWIHSELWVWILWPMFALINDAAVCRTAQDSLRKNFRLWAVPSYGEVPSIWGRLGRRLGLLRRRWREGFS
jgi:ABC-type transport system involved in multi-copper enzyme maturation permease subunit